MEKLEYVTNLNWVKAIKGDNPPSINYVSQASEERREVVMKFTRQNASKQVSKMPSGGDAIANTVVAGDNASVHTQPARPRPV